MKKNKPKEQETEGRIEFETFREFSEYEQSKLTIEDPWCQAGKLCIRKYRVIFEPIHESTEILRERLQGLWETEVKPGNYTLYREEAERLEVDLKGAMGAKSE